jgi:4-hydroxy-tetrahydrodipicolinate synthase
MRKIFKGLITAVVTPFKNDKIDVPALEKMIEYQIKYKVDGLVLAGSTGEGASLTIEEYQFLIKSGLEIARGRIDVMAGCSLSSTHQAVELAKIAEREKANGIMVAVPPYVKPTQEGIYRHFQTIHDAANLPIILYSVPSRTSVDFIDDTILRLSLLPRIAALKDASNDIQRPLRLSASLPANFNLLSGNDDVSLAYNVHGGVGCVSVASNITPKLCKALQDTWQNEDFKTSFRIQQELMRLYKALFIESNPIGVKCGASYLGLCSGDLRLPLTIAQDSTRIAIEQAIEGVKRFEEEL